MIYVDENLCSSCGACVQTCRQSALSIVGDTATIDQDVCAACGRCVDACLAGAIVILEVDPVVSDPRITVPAQGMATSPVQSPPPPLPARPNRFDTVERVLSGLFGIAGFALDHDLVPRRKSRALTSCGAATGSRKNAGKPCGQGRGDGGGRAGRRTPSGSRRGNRRRIQRQDGFSRQEGS